MSRKVNEVLGARPRLAGVWRRCRPYRWALLGSAIIAAICIISISRRAGAPALPLDDAFIHLQFARRLAGGHGFSFTPGGSYSSGATSWLWPMSLVPWFWFGLDGLKAIWATWFWGWVIHAAIAVETYRIARGIGGEAAGRTAGAMCLLFGGFVWFAYSGMETNALAWLLMRTVRVASELCEMKRPTARARWHLAVLGLIAPLLRPEGVLASVMAAIALGRVAWPLRDRRALVLGLPLLGPCIMPFSHWAATGNPSSSTAQVKWLWLDPYLTTSQSLTKTVANVELLVTNLLNGGPWTSGFLPEGFVWALGLGLVAMIVLARRHARHWRAAFVAMAILGTVGVCSYDTLLWNRVRYIWPFAASWFVAACCFPVVVGRGLTRVHPVLLIVSPTLLGGGVAWLATKLPDAVDDLAQSARAIHLQQVKLGRWAHENLPKDARIGVNDTGAIAYFSQRSTFDIVGLTTPGEAEYWAAGAGSRFEHYERLGRGRLPTHFIVYPSWIGMSAILGPVLTEATVTEQSILGSDTMVAYRARYDLLNSGVRPFGDYSGDRLVDEIDVADLIHEREHHYWLGEEGAAYDRVKVGSAPDGSLLADGGRLERAQDRFQLRTSEAVDLVMRTRSDRALVVWMNGRRVGQAVVTARTEAWEERSIALPGDSRKPRTIVVQAEGKARFDSYHYWCFASGLE